MESYEKGVLTKEDTYGIDLTWGSAPAMVEMVKKIGERAPGLGYLLGEGCKIASERIGQGSEQWAIQMKGQEIAAHNWRAQYISALNYCTGVASGPNHERGNSQHIWVGHILLPVASDHVKTRRALRIGEGRERERQFPRLQRHQFGRALQFHHELQPDRPIGTIDACTGSTEVGGCTAARHRRPQNPQHALQLERPTFQLPQETFHRTSGRGGAQDQSLDEAIITNCGSDQMTSCHRGQAGGIDMESIQTEVRPRVEGERDRLSSTPPAVGIAARRVEHRRHGHHGQHQTPRSAHRLIAFVPSAGGAGQDGPMIISLLIKEAGERPAVHSR